MSWQRPQKTVKYVMAPYTEGGRYKTRANLEVSRTLQSRSKSLVQGQGWQLERASHPIL